MSDKTGYTDGKYRYHFKDDELLKGGVVKEIIHQGIMYVLPGSGTVDNKVYEEAPEVRKVWYKWGEYAYPSHFVTVMFDVNGTVDSRAYTMAGIEGSPDDLVVQDVWRKYIVDDEFMGRYKVGIYIGDDRYSDGAILMGEYQQGLTEPIMDARQYFKLSLGEDFISGPYYLRS